MINVVPFIKPPQKIAKCSFCEKSEKDVAKLFSNGIDKHICDQCVIHAKQRLTESEQNENRS